MHLVIITVEGIKAMIFRHTGCAAIANSPFAETTGYIIGLFEDLGDGDILGTQSACRSAARIRSDRSMARMLAGHEDAASRRTHRSTGHALGKPHAFGGHSINIRRFHNGMAHTG